MRITHENIFQYKGYGRNNINSTQVMYLHYFVHIIFNGSLLLVFMAARCLSARSVKSCKAYGSRFGRQI